MSFQQTAGQLQVGLEPWSVCYPGALPALPTGVGSPGKKPRWKMGRGGLFFTWMEKSQYLGMDKEMCDSSEKADHGQSRTTWGSHRPGQPGLGVAPPVDCPVPTNPRPSSHSLRDHQGPQESQRGCSVQGTNTRPCRGGWKVPERGLSKALKSKCVWGGLGTETPPQTGSSGSSCSGLQDRWARPRAGGTPGRVRKDSQVLKQKAH